MSALTRLARLLPWSWILGPWAFTLASAQTAAPTDLAALLARPIIAPALPLAEVRAYTAGRVPAMPTLTTLAAAIQGELDRVSQTLTSRIRLLADRYAAPLPQIVDEVEQLAAKVAAHLQKMGAY